MPNKKLNISNPVDQFLTDIHVSNININPSDTNLILNEKPVKIKEKSCSDKDNKGKELKRKRYNLLFVPSLFKKIVKITDFLNISINEAMNQALFLYCEAKKDILDKYNELEKLRGNK